MVLVVALAPKSNSSVDVYYDPTWRTRAGVLAVASIALFFSLIGVIAFVCVPHVRASRVIDDAAGSNIVY